MPFSLWKLRPIKSVSQDWRSQLSAEKSQAYEYALAETKPAHVIFSIALDEALMLRRSGKLGMAREQADVSANLCTRFAAALECLLDVVERHADNFGLLPSVKPLDPSFFAGGTAQRSAAKDALLSGVLFSGRKRFLHKARTLGEIACAIAEEYRVMAAEVSAGGTSSEDWDHLSLLQYDLTTSLSEATVMLKSFIISLPPGQVTAFQQRLAKALAAMRAAPQRLLPKRLPGIPALTDRRAAAFRRE